jgi:hypothetical protein
MYIFLYCLSLAFVLLFSSSSARPSEGEQGRAHSFSAAPQKDPKSISFVKIETTKDGKVVYKIIQNVEASINEILDQYTEHLNQGEAMGDFFIETPWPSDQPEQKVLMDAWKEMRVVSLIIDGTNVTAADANFIASQVSAVNHGGELYINQVPKTGTFQRSNIQILTDEFDKYKSIRIGIYLNGQKIKM